MGTFLFAMASVEFGWGDVYISISDTTHTADMSNCTDFLLPNYMR